VQPLRDGLLFADRPCVPGEHQEGRLDSVLGILVMVQHPPADAKHHRSVPCDQDSERFLVLAPGKRTQQGSVGLLATAAAGQTMEVPHEVNELCRRHLQPSALGLSPR
jgi:hypothetical protein